MHLERSSISGVKLQVYNIYKSEPFWGAAWGTPRRTLHGSPEN